MQEQQNQDSLFNKYLDSLYDQLSAKDKSVKKSMLKLPNPKLSKVGTTRVIWENFQSTVDKLNRPAEHMQHFFASELGTECTLSQKDYNSGIDAEGTVSGPAKLVIRGRGRYQKSGIIKILNAYIDAYVQCSVCGDMDTILIKEQRQYFVVCNKCLSKHCCQV